jgi:HK97 family phage prohead protease
MSDRAEIETRSAPVVDVRFPDRIIELVAVPYNEWAPVEYKGRMIEESFNPGAFGQVQNRARRFLVNLEHDPNRVTGRVNALHPDRAEGLVAELRIRRGPEGDQVLDDADDGMIGASVGFGALPEHQHWETRSRRKIMRAFLDHIGLTFTPAYTGAGVLAVRSDSPPTPIVQLGRLQHGLTPNLDRIMLDRLVERYSHT